MAQPTPFLGQRSDCVTHFERHQHGLECWVLSFWHWIVEDHHHPVTGITFEGAAILGDAISDSRRVLTQERGGDFRVVFP